MNKETVTNTEKNLCSMIDYHLLYFIVRSLLSNLCFSYWRINQVVDPPQLEPSPAVQLFCAFVRMGILLLHGDTET